MQDGPRRRIMPAWQAILADVRQLAEAVVRVNDNEVARRLPEHAEALYTDARHLAEAISTASDQAASYLPGYPTAKKQLRRAEAALLREIKQRLDEVADADLDANRTGARARLLEQLLTDSLDANPDRSRENLHLRILRSLVPDEARILAALADGDQFPMVHVEARGGSGGNRTVLANASTVGRVAAIHLNSAVPVYLTHLRELGLVQEGPHNDQLSDQYALLANEDYVRAAIDATEDRMLRGAKVVQRTVRISPLGTELWAACRPDEPTTSPRSTNGSVVGYRSAYAGVRPAQEKDRR
ncbi:MAG TPA: Abi-alpha family protein [Pseudonocardia sp.]|uniref:Abi-alpha family protein n=1 Tax=Pseudonocardia sp. TaxID=60912 RepID=UPI002F407145